uniref:Shortage in chiasmata 1 n=1 Tax=Leptobrachium leishanense TaxID=445787 RepID=A0A8C5PGS9_9ANUR
METSIFPAFKFLALDYVYENVIKKKVTTSLMCLPFPEEVQEKENYCHDRIFTSDDYRRPWTRSSALSVYKVHHDGSALEELKQCTDITDRLEKRRTPCSIFTTNGELSVVPSSNPDSLTDLEEIFSIAEENDFSEDEQTNGECWSLSVPSSREKTPEAYLFQDDLVFDDYLAKYQSHLPSLATLSRRIKTINVEDPLINWRRNISAFEQLFRVNTSKAMDTKQNACPEEFHVERTDFTENLMLPCPVTINDYPTRSGNCVAKVTSMLQLAPEIMEYSQAEGQNTCTEFQLKVAVKRHFLEHLLIKRNLDLTKYENIEDGVSRTSKHEVELEVPLTPPDTSNKCWMHTSDFQCAAEEISSSPPKLQVIKKRGDILESLSCMSDVYHLLLKVPHINYTIEHLSISDLKQKLSVMLENYFYTNEDCNWQSPLELGLSAVSARNLELLTTDYSCIKNKVVHKVEDFIRISAIHLECLLEEKENLMKQNASFENVETPSASQISSSQYIPSDRILSVSVSDVPACEQTGDWIGKKRDRLDSDLQCLNGNNRMNISLNTNPSLEQMTTAISNPKESHIKSSGLAFSNPESISNNVSDASDLLNNFIMLRTVQEEGQCSFQPLEEPPIRDKLKNNTTEPEINSPSPASTLLEAGLEELSSSVEVPPSESQCQAYKVIQATAAPILRKLKDLGLVECMNWEFNTVTFDCSRFLLRQQEKNLTDSAKTGQYEYAVGSRPHVPSREENAGKDHDKEVLLFKNASLYHIMVTLRDLVLMCSVDTAVGYLYEAKELYKSALGSSLDDVCRKLEIVQFVAKKKPDVNHKIAALQSNLLQWIEQRHVDDEQLKVLIITRMDTVDILIDGLCEIKSVKAVMCCPPPGRKCLESKSILDSLEKYTCIVVNNQHIGGDFPWSHVSLVIEYDCTDYWGKVCQGLQIPHMTLKTCTPDICSDDTILDSCMNSILQIQIPYVFIASEGLLKNPEVLQLLESSYNMTFIERGCSASILLFGNMLQCAQITVDECTSIILQDLGQLKHEKSSENLILKLVALSLQYSCCWILLYTKEIIHSEYSLSENILHNISLLYAAIISLTSSKSGELEVKVVLTSGVEKAGLMIRQIADHTLISSKNAPHKWMDRSWLSLMTSEHFSDITSLHQLSISASSTPNDLSQSLEMENMYRSYFHQSLSVSREPDNNTKDLYLLEKHMTEGSNACEDLSLLTTNEMATSNVSIRPLLFYKGKHCKCVNSHPYQNMRHGQTPTLFHYPANYIDVDQAQLVCGTFLLENHDAVTESLQPSEEFILGKSAPTSISYAKQPLKTTHCVNVYAPPTNETACSTENSPDIVFTNNDKNIKCNGSCQLFHHGNLFQNKDYFITNLLNHQSLEKSNSLCDFIKPTQPMAPENQLQYTTKERPQSIFPNVSHHDLGNLHSFQFERGVIPGDIYTSKKHISPEKEMLNGLQCVQITQVKRRKLSYEKVPGRRDGQTRLKFF